jgi:predicted nucleic acid-binding protein
MPGSIVDLTVPGTPVPGLVAVDTNVVANLLLASFFTGTHSSPLRLDTQRAIRFFQDLQAIGGIGIVTPTAFVEFVHVAIKGRYNHEINITSKLQMVKKYGKAFNYWEHLYKRDSAVLQAFKPQLNTLKSLLVANGLMFLEPELLDPIVSGRKFDDEIIELVTKYGLGSSDTRILMETQCCGILDIATFDKDMQRASADFNIYTWL